MVWHTISTAIMGAGQRLSSTSLTTDENGVELSRQLYYLYGEERGSSGALATDYQFTG